MSYEMLTAQAQHVASDHVPPIDADPLRSRPLPSRWFDVRDGAGSCGGAGGDGKRKADEGRVQVADRPTISYGCLVALKRFVFNDHW